MNRFVTAVIIILLIGIGGWYVMTHAGAETPAPEEATPEQSNLPNGWVYSQPNVQGIQFAYPATLGTTYLSAQEWPPSVELVGGGFSCEPGEAATDGPRTMIEERTIGGHVYCIATFSEGAAGSVYRTYEYSTAQSNDFAARVVFTLRFPQCGNYGEAEEQACEREQAAFNVDSVVDRIVSFIRML